MRNSIPNVEWSQIGSLKVAKVAALLILVGKIIVDLIYCMYNTVYLFVNVISSYVCLCCFIVTVYMCVIMHFQHQ